MIRCCVPKTLVLMLELKVYSVVCAMDIDVNARVESVLSCLCYKH
jgi:hypothetical protein